MTSTQKSSATGLGEDDALVEGDDERPPDKPLIGEPLAGVKRAKKSGGQLQELRAELGARARLARRVENTAEASGAFAGS